MHLGILKNQPTFDIEVIFESVVDFVHWGKAGVSLGAQGCSGWWGTWDVVLCEINLLLIFRSYLKQLELLTLCTEGKLGSVLGPRVG